MIGVNGECPCGCGHLPGGLDHPRYERPPLGQWTDPRRRPPDDEPAHARDCRCNGCLGWPDCPFPSEPIRYAGGATVEFQADWRTAAGYRQGR